MQGEIQSINKSFITKQKTKYEHHRFVKAYISCIWNPTISFFATAHDFKTDFF